MLGRGLVRAGYEVELAETAKRAREVMANSQISATILAPKGVVGADLGLVGQIRESAGAIILVAESGRDIDRMRRWAPGADDYVAKPLDENDILARVETILVSRSDQILWPRETSEALYFEGLTIDIAGRIVRDATGRELPLPYMQFALLEAFARRPGQVLSRDQLRQAIAGSDVDPFERSVDVLVGRVRRKIERDPKAPRFIASIAVSVVPKAVKMMTGRRGRPLMFKAWMLMSCGSRRRGDRRASAAGFAGRGRPQR